MFGASSSPARSTTRNGSSGGALFPEARPRTESSAGDGEDGLDLDIGEVSRVVNLRDLMAPTTPRASGESKGNDRVGRGTGPAASLPVAGAAPMIAGALDERALSDAAIADASPSILTSSPRHSRMPLLLIGGVGITAIAALLLFLLLRGQSNDSELRAGSGGGIAGSLEELGYRLGDPERVLPRVGSKADDSQPTRAGGARTTSRDRVNTGRVTTPTKPSGGGGLSEITLGDDAIQPLSPLDIVSVSRKYATGTRRCYERALKADPFLRVRRIDVRMIVNAAGTVTNVDLSDHANDELGKCLLARMRKWQFRRSTEGISTQFPIVFEQK